MMMLSDAVIVGILSLIGTALGSLGGMHLISYRIEQLEIKVNKHNDVITRTFILEEKVSEAERRISALED